MINTVRPKAQKKTKWEMSWLGAGHKFARENVNICFQNVVSIG